MLELPALLTPSHEPPILNSGFLMTSDPIRERYAVYSSPNDCLRCGGPYMDTGGFVSCVYCGATGPTRAPSFAEQQGAYRDADGRRNRAVRASPPPVHVAKRITMIDAQCEAGHALKLREDDDTKICPYQMGPIPCGASVRSSAAGNTKPPCGGRADKR